MIYEAHFYIYAIVVYASKMACLITSILLPRGNQRQESDLVLIFLSQIFNFFSRF